MSGLFSSISSTPLAITLAFSVVQQEGELFSEDSLDEGESG